MKIIHIISILELIVITILFFSTILPDWDKQPSGKFYFGLLFIGELLFDLYSNFKTIKL